MACMFTIANFQVVLVDSHQFGDICQQLKLQSPSWRHHRGLSASDRVCKAAQCLTTVEKHDAICYCYSKQIKPKTEVQHERQLCKELAKIVVNRMLPHEKLSSRDVIGLRGLRRLRRNAQRSVRSCKNGDGLPIQVYGDRDLFMQKLQVQTSMFT